MKIITFNNQAEGKPTTGHLWNGGARTACGRALVGDRGHVDSDNLRLCGNCEKVIVSEGSTMWWRYAAA